MTFALLEAGYGIDGVLISSAVSSVLLMVCLVRYQWQEMGTFGCFKYSAKILKFGLPALMGGASMYMITGLDRWVMASFVGVEELAIYAVSGKFALLLGLLLQPYALWWFPNRVAMLQQPGGSKKCADSALVGVNFAIVLGSLMILTVPGFISLILPSSYHYAGTLVVALLAISVIKNAGDYLNLGCFSGDSSQSQMWVQGGVRDIGCHWLFYGDTDIWCGGRYLRSLRHVYLKVVAPIFCQSIDGIFTVSTQ